MQDRRIPTLAQLGRASWQLIGVGIVVLALIWLLGRLWVLVLAFAVAILFARALAWPTRRLRSIGFPRSLAALSAMVGLAALLAGVLALVVPELADEFDKVGDAVEDALDDVEDWLVEDSPFDLDRTDIAELRDRITDAVSAGFEDSGGGFVSGALLAFEILTGLILATITCFFMLKDGDRFRDRVVVSLRADRRPLALRLSDRAWTTLGGYLLGAAILGVVEALILGATMALVGSALVLPIMTITFLAAFVPFAGALVAGVLAVLVTLATAGTGAAVVVAIVAIVVQQLDNDLLAPVIYGKSLSMHPLVILAGLVAGAALFGPGGALISVPVVAVGWNVAMEYREEREERLGSTPDLTP